MSRWTSPSLIVCYVLGMMTSSVGILLGQEGTGSKPSQPTVDFNRDIRPLLARKCFACHGPDGDEAGLRLHLRDEAIKELDSGAIALVPGSIEKSELLKRVTSTDAADRMPPEGKPLTEKEVELVQRWIQEGAEYQEHWSFQKLKEQTVPEVQNKDWCRTAIDRFILSKLEQQKLTPVAAASPEQLIRRVYFDLTGLPPTAEQVAEFAADPSEDNYERLIDRLLVSPAYGERWGRHWLDIVRYAETNSFERDGVKPNAWKYRDYVIDSFNSDKSYQQFVREQIAGDEISPQDREAIIATGFYRLGIWDDEPADPQLAVFDGYDDIVTTMGQAFLGLTINCARCHDHKIDPIPQRDYYQMVAFVRDVTPYAQRGDGATNNQWDLSPEELKQSYTSLQDQERKLNEELEAMERVGIVKMPAPLQRATEGGERAKVLREELEKYLSKEEWSAYKTKRDERKDVREQLRDLPPRETVMALAKCEPNPPTTKILMRGSPQAPGDEVLPAFPTLFGNPAPEIAPPQPGARSAGRRTVLADWLASNENRLTSRVIVNRLWQHHFGRGIVRSPNNFGQMGERPTHPELLDYLSQQLINKDWSLKALHRELLLSATYRLSSENSQHEEGADPNNDYFWRFNIRRLSAEEIRDSALAVTGQINLQQHGKSFFPKLAAEVLAGQSQPGAGWGDSSPAEQARRSVYIHIKRSLVPPMLSSFDFPETDSSCEARFLTTQPAQALSMLNGSFMHQQAEKLAERCKQAVGQETRPRIAQAIYFALSRKATELEIEEGLRLVDDLQSKHQLSLEQAIVYHSLLVLNTNEFVYLD